MAGEAIEGTRKGESFNRQQRLEGLFQGIQRVVK
jgi:hypothetical protein